MAPASLVPPRLADYGEVEDYQIVIGGIDITGTAFDDANGSQVQNGGEAGTNAGGLYVNLLDSTGTTVISTTLVSASGVYAFSNMAPNTPYVLQLTTNQGVVGNPAPAVALPANWATTGENAGGTPDGTPDSKLTLAASATNVSGQNFGLEQLPDSNPVSAASQVNPGGTTQVQVPALSGSDPEDGAKGTGMTLNITELPTNGRLYYNGLLVNQVNQQITNYDPALLTVDPDDGALTVTFKYAVVDAAGKPDPTPAAVSMPFGTPTAVRLSTLTASSPNPWVDWLTRTLAHFGQAHR